MNKMKFSKKWGSGKRPEGLRVIYHKRNNYKQQYQQQPQNFSSRPTLNESSCNSFHTPTHSIDQVKSFVRNRLKTQYSYQFQGRKQKQRKSETPQPNQDQSAYPSKSVKTLNCHDNKSDTSSLNIQATHIKPEDDISFVGSVQGQSQGCRDPQLLDKLEENIESRLQKRLKKCLQYNKTTDWDSQSDMGDLVSAVRGLKTDPSNPENNEDIHFSDKKICLFEKLMASKAVESDILKKYYFSKISKPLQRHAKSSSLYQIETVSKSPIPIVSRKQSFIKTSANNNAFVRHDKSAYNIQRKGNDFFSVDRHLQPLPRSSYDRQFLSYKGYVPTVASKPEDSSVMKNSSTRVISSSYKRQFVNKKTINVNLKELDAYRNKIKNLPISFGKKQKDQVITKIASYLNSKNKGKVEDSYVDLRFPQAALLSESRKQYVKLQGGVPSRIKHQNLSLKKYQYKNKYHV